MVAKQQFKATGVFLSKHNWQLVCIMYKSLNHGLHVLGYVIVISRLGGMYPVYSHEHEGAKRPSASDCKPDTSRLGVI